MRCRTRHAVDGMCVHCRFVRYAVRGWLRRKATSTVVKAEKAKWRHCGLLLSRLLLVGTNDSVTTSLEGAAAASIGRNSQSGLLLRSLRPLFPQAAPKPARLCSHLACRRPKFGNGSRIYDASLASLPLSKGRICAGGHCDPTASRCGRGVFDRVIAVEEASRLRNYAARQMAAQAFCQFTFCVCTHRTRI